MLDSDTAAKLVKICGMFGSEHPGERAAAAVLADEIVRKAGLTWAQVIASAPKRHGYSRVEPGFTAWAVWQSSEFASGDAPFGWAASVWLNAKANFDLLDAGERMLVSTPWDGSFSAHERAILANIERKLKEGGYWK